MRRTRNNFISYLFSLFFILCFFIQHPPVQARIMSGSKSERKLLRTTARLLKSARRLRDKHRIKKAIDKYWKILEINPQSSDAYIELALIYVKLKIYDRVVELLEPGLEIARGEKPASDLSNLYCILTQAQLELGNRGKASKALIKAALLNPKSPLPRKILGDIYLSNNRIKSAIKAYKKALSLDPFYQPAADKLDELSKSYPAILAAANAREKIKKKAKLKKLVLIASTDKKKQKGIGTTEKSILPISTAKLTAPKVKPTEKLSEVKISKKDIPKPIPSNSSPEPELNSKSVDEAIDKLLAGDYKEKNSATKYLISKGKKGINAVEDLLYDSDPDVRIIAVGAFGKFVKYKKDVLIILEDAMDDPDEDVRKAVKASIEELKK